MKTTAIRIEKLVKGYPKNIWVNPGTERSVDAQVYAQRVEKKAYELYETRGRQDGHDWDDWLEAQRIVEQEMISGK